MRVWREEVEAMSSDAQEIVRAVHMLAAAVVIVCTLFVMAAIAASGSGRR